MSALMADTTESSIVILAEPGAVLDVIADVEAYPDWAKEIKSVEILTEEGDGWPDRVTYTMDAGVIKDTYTLDYDWDVDEDGTGKDPLWQHQLGLLLESTGEGATAVGYKLVVDLKIPVLGMLKRKAERVIIETALKDLKKRVESL